MFFHNFKYTIKILFKNKTLIFWTFAFPIILGFFFHMAFGNIEKDETLQTFDIAVVDNYDFKEQTFYQNTLKQLEKEELFKIHYVSTSHAKKLLNQNKIEGYLLFKNDEPCIVVKENGIEQTILQFTIDEIKQNHQMIEDLTNKKIKDEIQKQNYIVDSQQIVEEVKQKLNKEDVSIQDTSNKHLNYIQVEYYTLIAMACMYGGMLGLAAINNQLANMSFQGKRVSVSPNKKSTLVLSSAFGSYVVSLIGISLLLLFLKFILKVDFGQKLFFVVLLAFIGDLAGNAFGIFIASVFRFNENVKTGMTIAISMLFSVLSGMMGVTLKYVIDQKLPIINLMNPNNLITDGFYSLYYYSTFDRYFRDVSFLIIFIVVCLVISFISLRGENYDHL